MQDHIWRLFTLDRLRIRTKTHDITADIRRVLAVMTSVKCCDQLGEDTPDELLLCILVLGLEPLDDLAEIPAAAVLHVQVKILSRFEMISFEVLHDVRVLQFLEDGQFGLQLFPFFGRHLRVTDLFPTEDLEETMMNVY